MIKKIIFSLIFVCLIVAIPLAVMGIKKVELGEPFLAFIRVTADDAERWKLSIPEIPKIPVFSDASGFELVLNALIKFINVIIWLLNAIRSVINLIIGFLQFFFFLIKNLFNLSDTLSRYAVPVGPLV